jgi:hypothetical protein
MQDEDIFRLKDTVQNYKIHMVETVLSEHLYLHT